MQKMLLIALGSIGLAWGQASCYLKNRPFLMVETGVSGGFALRRDTVLLVLPNDRGGAEIWLEDHGKCRRGQVNDYSALAGEVVALGAYELPAYQPFADHLDPYGLTASLHVHDGNRCFSYSPQRDCSVDGTPGKLPSAQEREQFRQICARIRSLESRATTAVTAAQFQAAQSVLWKS